MGTPKNTPRAKSLRDAFKETIMLPKIWKTLRYGRQTIMNRRVQVRKGTYPTEPVMRKLLSRAGWKLAVKEQWAKK